MITLLNKIIDSTGRIQKVINLLNALNFKEITLNCSCTYFFYFT